MIYASLALSIFINLLAGWYIVRLLRKFLFISSHVADFYLLLRAFRVFLKGLWSMERYHGEPMIQELIYKVKEINVEIEVFRDTFEYMLDVEMEEELHAAEDEAQAPIEQ
tara:strand:- start:14444 stop:14773 length:330 start_codon:yes stop_codon:yes gene_type:complete